VLVRLWCGGVSTRERERERASERACVRACVCNHTLSHRHTHTKRGRPSKSAEACKEFVFGKKIREGEGQRKTMQIGRSIRRVKIFHSQLCSLGCLLCLQVITDSRPMQRDTDRLIQTVNTYKETQTGSQIDTDRDGMWGTVPSAR
jgi:hypothetical protein